MNNMVNTIRSCGLAVEGAIPEINRGGCAIYAHEVAKRLDARGYTVGGLVAAIPYMFNGASLDAIREEVEPDPRGPGEWNEYGVSLDHVLGWARIDDTQIIFDAGTDMLAGVDAPLPYSYGPLPIYPGKLALNEMFLLTLDDYAGYWNKSFSREDIPLIREIVDEYLPI